MADAVGDDTAPARDSVSTSPAPKRRAFSVSDRKLYRGASTSALAARRAMTNAFTNVTRFVRSASGGEHDIVETTDTVTEPAPHVGGTVSLIEDPTHAEIPTRGRAMSTPVPVNKSWKISSKLPHVPATFKGLRRPRQLSLRRNSTSLVPWTEGIVQYVTSSHAYHGEDAGAISSYYHIVADGISAPFAGQAPETIPEDRVSSAVIAQALVRAVERALEDLTNRNKEALDQAAFEQAVCDAIHATRVLCARHRESRIATTLCVVYFDRWHSKLLSFTLGDSKCIVLRRGDLVFESTCTVREFNVPCVVNLAQPLEGNDYLVESFDLLQGDVCLTFSDGVSDNVYKDDILTAVEALENGATSLQEVCDSLVAQSAPDDIAAHHEQPSAPGLAVEEQQEAPAVEVTAVETHAETKTVETCTTEELRERLGSATMDDAEEATPPPTASTQPATDETHQHKPPSKRFYPFATAAAYEYRRRVLRQKAVAPKELLVDKNFQRHIRDSALLLDLHDGKSVMDRQVLISKAHRRPHYSLIQLHRMAQIRAKKPDDVTLLISRFA